MPGMLTVALLAATWSPMVPPTAARAGWLPAAVGDLPAPYTPHTGDLVFFANGSFFFKAAYRLTLTGPPTHVGIVVVLSDGSPVILEAVDRHKGVRLMSLPERLRYYDGQVWIRRCRCHLAREQEAALVRFALEEVGKPFATPRVLTSALTWPLRLPFVWRLRTGGARSRPNWFCSELVATACVRAGLIDANVIVPCATFPRDLYNDEYLDLGAQWCPACRWGNRPEDCAEED